MHDNISLTNREGNWLTTNNLYFQYAAIFNIGRAT